MNLCRSRFCVRLLLAIVAKDDKKFKLVECEMLVKYHFAFLILDSSQGLFWETLVAAHSGFESNSDQFSNKHKVNFFL